MHLTSFLLGASFIIGYEYYRVNYPEEYGMIVFYTLDKCICFYSSCQLIAIKSKYFLEKNYISLLKNSYVKTLISSYLYFNKLFFGKHIIKDNIEVVKDGEVILNTNINVELKKTEYDFMIYSNKLDKIIFTNNINVLEYTASNISFLLVELNIGNKEAIQIKFKNENYNYYIVNNRIDKEFILYFLRKYYKDRIDKYSNDEILKLYYESN